MTILELADRSRDIINGVPQIERRRLMSRIENTNITEAKNTITELEIRLGKLQPGDSMIPVIEKAIQEYRKMIDKCVNNIIAFTMMDSPDLNKGNF